jgi:hypothetical protein
MVIVPLYDEMFGRGGGTDDIQTGIYLAIVYMDFKMKYKV